MKSLAPTIALALVTLLTGACDKLPSDRTPIADPKIESQPVAAKASSPVAPRAVAPPSVPIPKVSMEVGKVAASQVEGGTAVSFKLTNNSAVDVGCSYSVRRFDAQDKDLGVEVIPRRLVAGRTAVVFSATVPTAHSVALGEAKCTRATSGDYAATVKTPAGAAAKPVAASATPAPAPAKPIPRGAKELLQGPFAYSVANTEQHCRLQWEKRGKLDKRMYRYCVRSEKKGHKKLVRLVDKHSQLGWLPIVMTQAWKQWTKRGVTTYTMVHHSLNSQVEGYLDIQYERKQPNFDSEKMKKCMLEWLDNDSPWSMTMYCYKR